MPVEPEIKNVRVIPQSGSPVKDAPIALIEVLASPRQ
jgi:hypothetical protein